MSIPLRGVEWLFTRPWRLIVLVALVALPLLVVSELSARDQQERLRASEAREAVSVADRTAATFGDHLLVTRNGLVALTFGELSTTTGVDRARTLDLADAARQTLGDEVERLYVLGDQRLVYVAIPGRGGDLFGKPVPRPELLVPPPSVVMSGTAQVRTNADNRISDPYRSTDGRPLTVISAARQQWPVLAADVDLARVAERIRPQLPTGDIYLADKNGASMLTLSRDDTVAGRTTVTAVANVPETSWRVVVVRPSIVASEIDPVLDQIRAGRIALVALLLLGAALVAVAGSQMVQQRRILAVTNDELARVSREKSRFLANMSHELRTPLNAIIGFSQLIEERLAGPLTDKQSEYIHDIAESGKHQLALINDILDLSKVEAGKMEFRPEPFDVAGAVTRVHTLLAPLAQEKGVRLAIDSNGGLPQVEHDPARFRQVLFNLLSNAVKFTPEGGSVTTRMRAVGEDRFEIDVADTGIGMTAEDLATIFQEFKRLDSAYAREQVGTGLGLALVRRLVERMGGEVAVTSAVGTGTTFSVRLPRKMPA